MSLSLALFMSPSLSNSGGKNSLDSSPSHWSYSQSSIKSTPTTVESKIHKEVDERNLFVGNLPLTVDKNRLMELFSPFGTLVEAKVIKDRNTGFYKDYGFVRYDCAAGVDERKMFLRIQNSSSTVAPTVKPG
ncbi:hypothetical protein MKW98_004306 [Papaver atlanticum]|uniref:RRM domain-containing protein n=1 Tax=Papaver atlanticum TaxID=357466 RepID=A0AAD4T6G4_9MAGN|nr:hypothetical protein MKW98_004306 [Papaver atlanticum]